MITAEDFWGPGLAIEDTRYPNSLVFMGYVKSRGTSGVQPSGVEERARDLFLNELSRRVDDQYLSLSFSTEPMNGAIFAGSEHVGWYAAACPRVQYPYTSAARFRHERGLNFGGRTKGIFDPSPIGFDFPPILLFPSTCPSGSGPRPDDALAHLDGLVRGDVASRMKRSRNGTDRN